MTTTSCNEEVWRDIPGYEGKYQASTLGRIRSVDRVIQQANGISRRWKGRVLKPAGQRTDPHLRVVLGHGTPGVLVHVLVAATFLGPRPEGYDTRHLDGNPTNNRLDNLTYGTRTENILDVYSTGRAWRTLTIEQVREIRRRLSAGERAADLAREYGVGDACISAIKHRRTYSWLKD